MATAPLIPADEPESGTIEPGGEFDDGAQTQPRDIDAEARQHGWTPKEEFRGDPARWVDAETFVKKASEVMPLLRKQNEHFKRELADLKKQMRRASEFYTQAEERAMTRALAELQEKQDEAAGIGDVAGVKHARDEMAKLAADAPTPPSENIALEAKEALINWREANPWFDKGGLATDYAQVLAEKHRALTTTMAPADFYEMIGDKVKERYGATLNALAAPRKQPGTVDAGGVLPRSRGGGKTFADLPANAQRACDKWIKSGLIKTREAYVKDYDWS